MLNGEPVVRRTGAAPPHSPRSTSLMDPLEDFLRPLFEDGRVRFHGPPAPLRESAPGAVDLLRRRHALESLDLAGPALAFEPVVAIEAAEFLRQACWSLLDHSEPPETLASRLRIPRNPRRPADHFAADLTLRYLPDLHRRARAIHPGDPLAPLLREVLRRWPLSGVLGGMDEGPSEPPDLGDHLGLWMLYAERLAAHEHPGWRPAESGLEVVALVWRGLGREYAPLPSAGGEHV